AGLRGYERCPCMIVHIGLQVREVAAGTRSLTIGGSRWFEGHREGYERASENNDGMLIVGVSDDRCLMPIGNEPQSNAKGRFDIAARSRCQDEDLHEVPL